MNKSNVRCIEKEIESDLHYKIKFKDDSVNIDLSKDDLNLIKDGLSVLCDKMQQIDEDIIGVALGKAIEERRSKVGDLCFTLNRIISAHNALLEGTERTDDKTRWLWISLKEYNERRKK